MKFYLQRENPEFSGKVRVDAKERTCQFWKRNPLSMEHSGGVSAGMLFRLKYIAPYEPAEYVAPVKNYNNTFSHGDTPVHSPVLISSETIGTINMQTGTTSKASAYLNQIHQRASLKLFFIIIFTVFFILNMAHVSLAQPRENYMGENRKEADTLLSSFISPPSPAKPRVYWWWLFNRVDKAGITRDLEEFKAKGISGVNLICTGGYAGREPLPGVKFLGDEWRDLFRHALREVKRLNMELGFNLAGGWTMMGPTVTKDNAMKKVVSSELRVSGASKFSGTLPQPEIVEDYYHDIMVQAFQVPDNTKEIEPKTLIDLTAKLDAKGHFEWDVPKGKWVILRTGYTLTGHTWSKWHAYPKGDTFQGGEGYEIDYLNAASMDDYFNYLGKIVIEEAKKAGGHLDYLWSDSWECGKLTWTQDFPNQFNRFRGYDLKTYMPVLAGYTVTNADVSARFRDDFDRTIQDCIAENFYGRFESLCHQNGIKVGNEAGGPNDIPPQDALKNFGHCDILSGEFWANGHCNSPPDGYNKELRSRFNLKQTATASHVYGKAQAAAEAFTQQEAECTHWSLGPSDLKPYANDAFCEGINRFMLHQATCQPPSDGKPGYEFCAGQHFTPNLTWWEQSPAFFSYLSRCQYMLQQGKFAGDVCFYLGERPPLLAPPKYLIPSLGPGYDCDYSNAEVLLTRMSVKDGRIVLPDGMSYRLLVLQNCTSTSPEICKVVGSSQHLSLSPVPSNAMSLPVIEKIRELINNGATVIGSPPEISAELKNYPKCDEQVRKIAAEIWGDLDGKTRTERRLGKGRIIWGKTPREVLLADGVGPDFTFPGQENAEQFDYIHRSTEEAEIYFVINRTNKSEARDFTFRVAGKQPEIWNAVTGKTFTANAYKQSDTATTLPLELDAFGSYFIVFRKPMASKADGKAERNFSKFTEIYKLSGTWNTAFDTKWGGPAVTEFPELISWTKRSEEGIKHYSGKATYKKTFDLRLKADGNKKAGLSSGKLFLDLGDVKNVAEVRLNGKKLGILWCAPWRVEITEVVKPAGNVLEVDVINLWANRVVGDLNLPQEKKFTKTHDAFRFDMLRANTSLLDAGLLGPVKVYLAN